MSISALAEAMAAGALAVAWLLLLLLLLLLLDSRFQAATPEMLDVGCMFAELLRPPFCIFAVRRSSMSLIPSFLRQILSDVG